MTLLAFFTPGPMELLIVAGVCILLFGPKQLPKMARSLGSALPSFRQGVAQANAEIAEFKKAEAQAEADAKKAGQEIVDSVKGKTPD